MGSALASASFAGAARLPVEAVERGDMIQLPLSRGYVALIDDCDAHLAAFKWSADVRPNIVYAVRRVRRPDGTYSTERLHQAVMRVPPDQEVDHENHDGLDCRRGNLRAANRLQNLANQRLRTNNTSGFKGVSWEARRHHWVARIRIGGGRRLDLGSFATAEAAAHAYDAAALRYFGEFAWLNFPEAHG